jgi:hypothetical protein
MLNRCLVPTDQMIRNIFEIESGHINTRHPHFVVGAKESIIASMQSEEFSEDASR